MNMHRNPHNPYARCVPTPDDPVLLDAAFRAGRVSYRAYPYYRWRYGRRGELFTRSDSAWLVWLTTQPAADTFEQITWLGSVLTNRGMPGILLEQHLRVLHRALMRIPDRAESGFDEMEAASQAFQDRRLRCVSQADTNRLVFSFSRELGFARSRLLQAAGRLIVSAIADHVSGAPNSIHSLLEWLTDVDRLRRIDDLSQFLSTAMRARFVDRTFESQWEEAISRLIDATKQSVAVDPELELEAEA